MGSGYRYFGLRFLPLQPIGRQISLDTANLHKVSHVAVYIGAQSHDISSWVQGGVYRDHDFLKLPQAYIEVKHGSYYSLRHWPVHFGDRVHVTLAKLGPYWQIGVTVAGHLRVSHFVLIRNVSVAATGETFGEAHGSGHIDARFLRG